MKKRILIPTMALLLLLAMASAASAVSVTRDLPAAGSVDASEQFQVSITQSGFFVLGHVFEQLPPGYSYVDDSATNVLETAYNAATRTLTLKMEPGVTATYRVNAGSSDGTFAGTYLTIDSGANPITGDVMGDTVLTLADTGGPSGSEVSVMRDLPAANSVGAGEQFQVSITQSGFFVMGHVYEQLPPGYSYVDGSASNVLETTYDAGTRTLDLKMEADVTATYSVMAGASDGTFAGTYLTIDAGADPITGDVMGDTVMDLAGVVPQEPVQVTRNLPASETVGEGEQFQVSLTQEDFFVLGYVTEVLPLGYDYVDESATDVMDATYDAGTRTLTVEIDANTPTITYDVIAGTDDGTFTGTFLTIDQSANTITGDVAGDDTLILAGEGPRPSITNPANGATVSGTITLMAENTNDRTVVACNFEYSPDGASWTEIGMGTLSAGVWSIDWDTMTAADGSQMIKATMTDSEDVSQSAQIMVTLANPPEPRITSPSEGAKIMRGITINIIEVDDSGQDDIVSNTFEYSPDGTTWTLIGTDVSPDGGWKIPWDIPEDLEEGDYKIRATMEDVEGNTGTDEINISILSEGIYLYKDWNLFSVPGKLNNSDVEHVLDTIIPYPANALIYWDANAGQWVNVQEIEPLKAYAVFISEPATIVNLDLKPEPSGSLTLYAGDNLIGMTGYSSASAEVALSIGVGNIDNSYDKIFHWNTSGTVDLIGYNCNVFQGPSCPPVFYTVGRHETTEEFPMAPYEGYWVHMVEEAVYEGQTL